MTFKKYGLERAALGEKVYVRSDPLTLTFGPAWSQGYAEDSHQIDYTFADDDMIQGDWDSVGHSHGTQRGMGAMKFDLSGSPFGGRTNTTQTRIRGTIKSQYTSSGIYPRWAMHETVLSTVPSTFSHVHGSHPATGSRTTVGNQVWTDISVVVGNEFIAETANTIISHDFGDGTGSADKEYYRGTIHGETAVSGTEPKIEITADYV